MLFDKESADVIDESDVVTDEKDGPDVRIAFLQKGGAVDKDEGLAAPRGSGDYSVPAVQLPGDALLVVIEEFQSAGGWYAGLAGPPVGKGDPHLGKDHLPKPVEFPAGDGETGFYLEHSVEGFPELLSRRVGTERGLRVEVVPEENAIGGDYSVKPLLFVFKLVDVGKDDGAVYRHLDLVIGFRIF